MKRGSLIFLFIRSRLKAGILLLSSAASLCGMDTASSAETPSRPAASCQISNADKMSSDELWQNANRAEKDGSGAACWHQAICSRPPVKAAMQQLLNNALYDPVILKEKKDVFFPGPLTVFYRLGPPVLVNADLNRDAPSGNKEAHCAATFLPGLDIDIIDSGSLLSMFKGGNNPLAAYKSTLFFTVEEHETNKDKVSLEQPGLGLSKQYFMDVGANETVPEGVEMQAYKARTQGVVAAQQGQYGEAYRRLEEAAANGDVTAKYKLGRLYGRGAGLGEPDYRKSLQLIDSAASGGYLPAKHYAICVDLLKIMLDLSMEAQNHPVRRGTDAIAEMAMAMMGYRATFDDPFIVDMTTPEASFSSDSFACAALLAQKTKIDSDDDGNLASIFAGLLVNSIRRPQLFVVDKITSGQYKVTLMDPFFGNFSRVASGIAER